MGVRGRSAAGHVGDVLGGEVHLGVRGHVGHGEWGGI